MPSIYGAKQAAVSAAVPWNRPRMTICMLTEFMDRADWARTSVAHCFGPLLFRLRYENAESKRQIMEPGAREQARGLIFLPLPPPLEKRLLEKLKRSPSLQSSTRCNKTSAHEIVLFSSCFLVLFTLARKRPHSQLKGLQIRVSGKGEGATLNP